jgi:hypothetical protein
MPTKLERDECKRNERISAECYYKKKPPMRSMEEVEGVLDMLPQHQDALQRWLSGRIISAPRDYRDIPVDEWDSTIVEGDFVADYADAREKCETSVYFQCLL